MFVGQPPTYLHTATHSNSNLLCSQSRGWKTFLQRPQRKKKKKNQQQPRTPVKGVGGGGGVDGRENSNTLLSKNTSLKALEVAQGQTEYQF